MKFDYNGEPAILVNFGGKFAAYVNNCPHKNLPFDDKSLQGGKLVCPYHGAAFDPGSGKYVGNVKGLNFEVNGSLRMISLRIEGGNIYTV